MLIIINQLVLTCWHFSPFLYRVLSLDNTNFSTSTSSLFHYHLVGQRWENFRRDHAVESDSCLMSFSLMKSRAKIDASNRASRIFACCFAANLRITHKSTIYFLFLFRLTKTKASDNTIRLESLSRIQTLKMKKKIWRKRLNNRTHFRAREKFREFNLHAVNKDDRQKIASRTGRIEKIEPTKNVSSFWNSFLQIFAIEFFTFLISPLITFK